MVIEADKFTPFLRRGLTGSVRAAADLVFPPRCLLCRFAPGVDAGALCLNCAVLIDRERNREACPTCGAEVAAYSLSKGKCAQCRHRRFRIAGLARVGLYRDALGHALRSHKYSGREEWGPLLGRWLCEVVHKAPWRSRIEVVVSVPTHWRHRLGRPIYPARGLGRAVARTLQRPHLPILRRTRAGPHQVELSFAKRAANVRGAFAIRRGIHLDGAVILVVDDVRTTGATLEECARILRDGGAGQVYGAVILRAAEAVAGSPVLLPV